MGFEVGVEMLHRWIPEHTLHILGGVGFFVVLHAMSGCVSLPYLRGLPDLEHKAEMIWGAKWLWAVVLAALGVGYLVMYVGVTETPYPVTSALLGMTAFELMFAPAFALLRYQALGSAAVLAWSSARSRGDQSDFRSWLIGKMASPLAGERGTALVLSLGLVIAACFAIAALSYSYPLERELVQR